MSRTIIFIVLSIASTALATAPMPGSPSATSPPPVPVASSTSEDTMCDKLNWVNATHLLNPTDFKTTLTLCSNDSGKRNLTDGARVLLAVFQAISNDTRTCSLTGDVETKLIECVKKETKMPLFTVANAKSSFGLNNTYSLQFRYSECLKSKETSNCVEKVLSAQKWDANMKGCKNNILRGFQVTSAYCTALGSSLRDDRGSGYAILPTKSLILGTTLLLVKLIVSSGF